jgi:hypothetical protein
MLRTYRLAQAQTIPYRAEYGGCRSWIDVVEPISLEGMVPVFTDTEYMEQAAQIRQIVGEHAFDGRMLYTPTTKSSNTKS